MSDPVPGSTILTRSLLQVAEGVSTARSSGGSQSVYGSGIELSRLQEKIVEAFSLPRTFENGLAEVRGSTRELGPGEALDAACALIALGVLQPIDARCGAMASGRQQGMYSSPMLSLDDAALGDACDVAFIGMPYDLGVTGREGTRCGPSYLRRCSRSSFDYVEDAGFPRGWWNTARACRVLEGVRFADIANVSCRDSVRNGAAFDRLYDALCTLHAGRRLPVVIGGDHSISFAAISAAVSCHPRLGVLHFDAHPDLGRRPASRGWRRNLTHGNFMSWIEPKTEIQTIVQFGIRHLLSEPPYVSRKVVGHPGRAWVERISEIASALSTDYPYYLTLDVDCLDPTIIPQTGTPVPGGLSYHDACEALRTLACHVDIVGVDVVELSEPQLYEDYRAGTSISYLLFELLASIFERRRSPTFATKEALCLERS